MSSRGGGRARHDRVSHEHASEVIPPDAVAAVADEYRRVRDAEAVQTQKMGRETADERRGRRLRCVPYERASGWSSKASEAELKGVEVCRD